MIRGLIIALAVRLLVLLPQPPRQPLKTCSGCGTANEPDRTTCRNCGESF
jgi:hypothetical protein